MFLLLLLLVFVALVVIVVVVIVVVVVVVVLIPLLLSLYLDRAVQFLYLMAYFPVSAPKFHFFLIFPRSCVSFRHAAGSIAIAIVIVFAEDQHAAVIRFAELCVEERER